MDIVQFWQDQVTAWNDENKCDFCWEFGAPLVESANNVQQSKSEECCVHVFLTDSSFSETPKYSSTGFVNGVETKEIFTLWVLIPSKLGQNNYNEINGHDVSESKWKTIFKPLKDCVGSAQMIDACAKLGIKADIIKWVGELVTNYQNMNYAGWKINGTISIKE